MKATFTLLLLCFARIMLFAQSTNFYDKEKIGSQYINSFCQDKDNFLWIGTKNGLRRFDGTNFISYYHDDKNPASLNANEVHTLLVDNKNRIWVGTATGLQRFRFESDDFQSVIFPDININRRVTNIVQCSTGELLCNVSGIGLFSIDADSMTATPKENKNYSPYISCIFEDSKHRIWLGTSQETIACINPTTKQEKIHSLPFSNIKSILETEEGKIYAVSLNNLATFNEDFESFSELPYYGKKKNIYYETAISSKNGNIILGTYGQGLTLLKRGDKGITDANTMYSPFINTDKIKANIIFEDRNKNIWIGCDYQGILMIPYKDMPFHFWNLPITFDDIPGHINTILYDKENTLWCAIEDNGIYQFDPNGHIIRHINTPSSVSSMFEDGKGNLWVGMNRAGLFLLDKNNWELILKHKTDENSIIRHIAEDKHGNLYISILGKGVLRYSILTGNAIMFSDNPEIKDRQHFINKWVTYIMCDSQERIWFGHFGDIGNISCYDIKQNSFLSVPFDSHEKTGFCYSILEGKDHTIWMATQKGLVNYNPETKSYSVLTMDEGLSDNVICGLAKDKQGNLWCSTTNGICFINTDIKNITCYYTGNGLQDKSYLEGRCTTNKDGRIYFGGEKGITSFYPEDIRQVELKNVPSITNLTIGNRKVNMQTLSGGRPIINKELVHAENFRFSHSDNTFTFFLSMLDYRDEGNMSYEYRLKEYGKKWDKTLPGENRIQYHHLPPGKYTLQIRANENGSYSPVKSVEIHITPPLYFNTLAKTIYCLLVIGIGYLLIISYKRKRKEKIGEMKLQFFINIAHELRSPLTLITNPLEKLLKKENTSDTQKALLSIKHNTDRILNLVNQLLDIQKIDKGKMNLRFTKTDMRVFTSETLNLFNEPANQKNIQLIMEIPEKLPEIWIDQNNFDKVLVNLISNAIKYTPQGGKINICISTGENLKENSVLKNYMEISVSDTGKGLNEKEINRIFESFYQGDINNFGFGIGLNLCQLLVQLHHGTISACNREDTHGSRFIIRLPLGCKHLKKEEILTGETRTVNHIVFPIDKTKNEKKEKSKTNYHVLVIDDDEELRNYLEDNLSAYYHVETAKDGADGWKKAITHQPDLIVSDVVMPEMDGFQLLKELKKNINTNHIPIILLTSKKEFTSKIEGLSQGADGYMVKPFKMEELITLSYNLIENRILLKGKYTGNQTQNERIDSINLKGNDDTLIDRIMNVINTNISNPEFNVEMLAHEAGLSRTHLHRKMKELTGLSASDFIRNLRLRQAADLLKTGQSNVTQIAYAVGFSNQTHFSNTFKKVYGMTPTEYMESADKK